MRKHDIKGFVETSLCDWDGYISSVVFLAGCNFRCPFCQNGDLILRSDDLPTIEFARVADYLATHQAWIDGVVITGGEPTLCGDLGRLAAEFKDLGFKVKLDTNGTRPAVLERLLQEGLIDYVAMDIKAPLDGRYHIAAGVNVKLPDVKRSIEIVTALGDSSEFRTTLVPGIVGADEIEAIARSISGADKYVLQRFVPDNSLDNSLRRAVPYDDSLVTQLLDIAGRQVKSCFYRGKIGVGLS